MLRPDRAGGRACPLQGVVQEGEEGGQEVASQLDHDHYEGAGRAPGAAGAREGRGLDEGGREGEEVHLEQEQAGEPRADQEAEADRQPAGRGPLR